MKYIYFILFISFSNSLLAQISLPEGINLSKNQLAAFQEETERKKDQFISHVEKIARNQDKKIRTANIELGIGLFEDTAHIQVSNARTNTVKNHSVTDYFRNVVGSYYDPNPKNLTVIEFWASPVIIDNVVKDNDGRCIALRGHFTFVQKFCKCTGRIPQAVEEVPKYEHCYCDRTVKSGLITIKPIDSPTGLTWTVLLSGIIVNETTEQ